MTIPVYVLTSDSHLWLLRGFAYLFNTFWGADQPVTIAGCGRLPDFPLPPNFTFIRNPPTKCPPDLWSQWLANLLEGMACEFPIILLEDYWLTSPVDVAGVRDLHRWMVYQSMKGETILRLDLSADRAAKKQCQDYIEAEGFHIIKSPPDAPYQMSLQAAIWNRRLLDGELWAGESAWDLEVKGTRRLASRPNLLVLGTREAPLKYQPVYRGRQRRLVIDRIPPAHLQYIQRRGWLAAE